MNHAQRIDLLERMLRMRRFEEAVAGLAAEGAFASHYHLYIGQEATGAAVLEALRPDDLLVTTHRNHGHVVGRGADPGRALAEILGRAGGLSGGRGGTLHLCDRSLGFLSTSAMVGGAIGLATGGAYGQRALGGDGLTAAFFGDGVLEEGIAFETMNLAALWKLPVLFVCENNSVDPATFRPGDYSSSVCAAARLTDIPAALGIETASVDGADAGAVLAAAEEAVAGIRAGAGPRFLEAVTERWPGTRPMWPTLATGITDLEAAWDDGRIGGEHAAWIRGHDPVLGLARETPADAAREVDRRVAAEMAAARDFALASPLPDADTAFDRVFAGP